jgi:hypothetical protein
MQISKTHITEKSYLKLPKYTAYHTNHPAETSGGTDIILKNSIKHHKLNNYIVKISSN